MRERLEAMIGRAAEGVWLGTFHAIAARILRRHAEAVGLDVELHDPRHRRPAPPAEADHRRPRISTSGAGRRARCSASSSAGRIAASCPTRSRPAMPATGPTAARSRSIAHYQQRLATVNAVDFGDLLLHNLTLFSRQPRNPRRLPAALPLSAGRRVPGHQRRAVSVAAAPGAAPPQSVLRRRRRPVDLQLARRRDRQHPQIRERFSRRAGRPAGGELPLDPANPRRPPAASSRITAAGSARPCGPSAEAGEKIVVRGAVGRRAGGALGRRRDRGAAAQGPRAERDRDPGARRLPDPRVRGALHLAGAALSRDRRAALLRAPGNPRRARLSAPGQSAGRRSRLRAHRQHAAARHRHRDLAAAARRRPRRAGAAGRGGARC